MGASAASFINSILLIDDSNDYCNLLVNYFKSILPDAKAVVYNIDDGCPETDYDWKQYQLVIIDYDLGNGENGLDWIRACAASNDFPAAIMLTGKADQDVIVKAFRYGAQDFLHKNELTKILLFESVQRATKQHREEQVKSDTITLSAHIYNKSRFLKKVEEASKGDVVLVVEVDDYQDMHDEFGIITTDKVCSHIAKVISNLLKTNNYEGVAIRSGDAASAVLLKHRIDSVVAEKFSEELCEALTENPYKEDSRQIDYTVSIGAAVIDIENFDSETVFISADVSCRIARDKEGHSYAVYGDVKQRDKATNSISTQLENVFIKNRINPFFQHIVKVSDRQSLMRKENLYTTRMNLVGKDGKEISADQYMPVLQETNKLNTLDRWVIKFCINRLINEYKQNSIDTALFMTLTSSSYQDKNLLNWFEKLIENTDFPDIGYSLIIEIDVEKFLTFQNKAEKLIEQLREKFGISAALLHVPNHSVLEQCMKHMHFEYTRFSPTFAGNEISNTEMKEIVSTAHKNDSLVIADKLETGASLAVAIDAGVDYVSGYIIQPPQEELESEESFEI
ncbi:MAG: EAL domain-containing protein [Proteobacteria bacterium]|nr:EAL domain-containing protein [Pseudomonadota bacterium]NOG61385.1 EAL domain-containing protein [Pseudomonadota bacterium]